MRRIGGQMKNMAGFVGLLGPVDAKADLSIENEGFRLKRVRMYIQKPVCLPLHGHGFCESVLGEGCNKIGAFHIISRHGSVVLGNQYIVIPAAGCAYQDAQGLIFLTDIARNTMPGAAQNLMLNAESAANRSCNVLPQHFRH
jgi:hypothetical protein